MQEGRTLLQKGGLEIHIHFCSSHLSQIFCWAQYIPTPSFACYCCNHGALKITIT